MENKFNKNLLNELFIDPIKFSGNPTKGYELLNEYHRGLDIKTLFIILKSNDEYVYRVGISIASELDGNKCSILLPYLLPLFKVEQSPLYLHYLQTAIFRGTYKNNYEDFSYVVSNLLIQEYKIQNSVMHLLAVANINQLKESRYYFETTTDEIHLVYGLSYLIEEITKGLMDDFLINLIQNKNEIFQLFGGIVSLKRYNNKQPYFLIQCSESLNIKLRDFSNSILK